MKRTIITLLISVICLGLASIVFSFGGGLGKNKTNQERVSRLNSLPSSDNNFLTASLNPNFIPMRNWAVIEPDIEANAAGVFDLNGEKFLYQKNIKERLSIASLTKIMTAMVVLDNFELDDIITISRKAVMTEGENGRLIIGEKLTVRDLLHIMLIESSNDAAIALSDAVPDFIILMNKKAKELGLIDTEFADPAGISKWNYANIYDLAHLIKYSFDKPLIWQILSIKETEIYSNDEKVKHSLVNTNKLLGEIPEMVGGKTGFTDEAGGCMITMIKTPNKPSEYLITVVLGSKDRELETKKLIEWTQKAYVW